MSNFVQGSSRTYFPHTPRALINACLLRVPKNVIPSIDHATGRKKQKILIISGTAILQSTWGDLNPFFRRSGTPTNTVYVLTQIVAALVVTKQTAILVEKDTLPPCRLLWRVWPLRRKILSTNWSTTRPAIEGRPTLLFSFESGVSSALIQHTIVLRPAHEKRQLPNYDFFFPFFFFRFFFFFCGITGLAGSTTVKDI